MPDNLDMQLKQHFEHPGSQLKILYSGRIIEGWKDKDISKLSSRFTKNPSEDDDLDAKGMGKLRILFKKSKKAKLLKIKQDAQGAFGDIRKFQLDEIKSLEIINETQIQIQLGKPLFWNFESNNKKLEFLYNIISTCEKYDKMSIRLVNFDFEMLQDQIDLFLVQPSAQAEAEVEQDEEESIDEVAHEIVDGGQIDIEIPQVDLATILADFNWQAGGDAGALETSLMTELHALEATNVLDIIQSENQSIMVAEQIDKVIKELEEIDKWLLHHTILLEKMGNDVHQIEAQNKGMQVASQNQKRLVTELEEFIQSLRLPNYILEVLENEPLGTTEGNQECQKALEKVMSVIRYQNQDLNVMGAVSERISFLQGHINNFMVRLSTQVTTIFNSQASAYLADKTRSQKGAVKLHGHESMELKLYKFKFLLGWLKEIDARRHYDLQMTYTEEFQKVYKQEFGEFVEALKNNNFKKQGQEEGDYLFTNHSNSVGTAVLRTAINVADKSGGLINKLDWRSKKKEKSKLMHGGDDEEEETDSLHLGEEQRMGPDDVLGIALLKMCTIIIREQNFMFDLFTISKIKNAAVVSTISPTFPILDEDMLDDDTLQLWQSQLSQPRQPFKDPKAEKRMQELMDAIFPFVRELLLSVVDAGLKQDPSSSIGMMVQIETLQREYGKSCHAFILNVLEALHRKVSMAFDKFIVDQIKAIDEIRVSAKKRTGILPFVRVFPRFVDRMEKMLITWEGVSRKSMDSAYTRLVKSIFENLEVEAQQVSVDSKGGPEEKDHLNLHIITVENMHHFYSEVRSRKVPSLDAAVKQAKTLYEFNLDAYCKYVIRKPLGKLLDFFEGVEGLLKTGPADEVSYHVQYSKNSLKEVIKKYPGKEIKKGLEALYKRVDKHFLEEEGLLQVVWRGIQEEVCRQVRKYEELIAKCYPEITVRLEFTMEELLGYFSDLAQSH